MASSFRLRLALGAALLAGLALASFASIAWWQLRETRIRALDREFQAQAERELARPWPPEHWPRHEPNLARALGAADARQTLLLVQQRGVEVYRSRHWPETLDPTSWRWPEPFAHAGPALPEHRPPPRPRPRADPPPAREPAFFDDDPPPPRPGNHPPTQPAFSVLELHLDGQDWRFGLATTPQGQLAIGVELTVLANDLGEMRNALLLAMPLALGLIGLGAWFLSGRALTPLRQLGQTMEQLTAKGLEQRVDPGKMDREFHPLIRIFNEMLERLERSFRQASRFSADAAHELKTPLAILQGQIERAMGQCEAGSPMQAHLSHLLDEVQRLGTISRKLLLLSLADAGQLRLHRTPMDLSQTLTELLEDAQMLAPGLNVEAVIAPGLNIAADAELLRQLLHNLLSNAIKYNLPEGWIRIAASREPGWIILSIANASNDISPVERERLFERFYRADPARNRQVEGVGLGLSLAREIARAHGGELQLAQPLTGETRLIARLPA